MSATLKEKRAELDAKRKSLHSLYEEGGGLGSLDLEKIKSLGEISEDEKLHELRKRSEEIDRIGKSVHTLAELVEADKKRKLEESSTSEEDLKHQEDIDNGNADAPVVKSLGTLITELPAFKKLASGDKSNQKEELKMSHRETEVSYKATFTTSAGWPPESIRIPGLVIPFARQEAAVIDVIPTGSTTMQMVKYMEETTRTDAAAERAEEGEYLESQYALTERESPVRNLGHRVPVTDEQLEDVAGIRSYLDSRLVSGLRRRVSNQIINGAGTGILLRGILHTTNVGQENEKASPNPGDTVHETIFRAMTKVQVAGFANPNIVIIHPNDWMEIRLQKTDDGVYLFGNPDVRGSTMVWGIPRLVTQEIAAKKVITCDTSMCQIYNRRGIEVQMGYNGTDFINGRVTIRAGLRLAFVVYRPPAFVVSDLQA